MLKDWERQDSVQPKQERSLAAEGSAWYLLSSSETTQHPWVLLTADRRALCPVSY